jgi:cytochrome c oxidase cbb3-type subunit III
MQCSRRPVPTSVVIAASLLALAACKREVRNIRPDPAGAETPLSNAMVSLSPGGGPPVTTHTKKGEDYLKNAYELAQGKTLFKQMNCNGCHSNGGGGMGPALIDDEWIYGSTIENIVATIREGRPNGMPSFRGKITDDQIWQIAAYVVSMRGKVPSAAAPSRDDRMSNLPGESRRDKNFEKAAGPTTGLGKQ